MNCLYALTLLKNDEEYSLNCHRDTELESLKQPTSIFLYMPVKITFKQSLSFSLKWKTTTYDLLSFVLFDPRNEKKAAKKKGRAVGVGKRKMETTARPKTKTKTTSLKGNRDRGDSRKREKERKRERKR